MRKPFPRNSLTHEDDRVHNLPGLHEIRPEIEPMPAMWPSILGEAARPYAGNALW